MPMPLPSDLPPPPFLRSLRVRRLPNSALTPLLLFFLLLLLLLLLTFQSHCQYVGAALAAVDVAVAGAASELLIINILCTRLR